MELIYIYHSGFAIETDKLTIIIDFYKDSDADKSEGVVYSRLLKQEKPLYVLSSHSHHDHFSPEILSWKNIRKDITYIFSHDILENGAAKENDAVFLNKLDVYEDDAIRIKAFGSTDLGISFFIKIDDKQIVHAGDLNNWHWNEESTDEEINEAQSFYLRELDLLAKETKHLHLAMFPVDPRLGKDYMLGAKQFIEAIHTDKFSPMHFDEEYQKAAAFSDIAKQYDCQCICWTKKGEHISL